jgi:hypothetical protein
MVGKMQCWDFKQCGRELGGLKVAEFGVCPASKDVSSTGLNSGQNGGRICWAVTGTFCGNKVQGTFAQKELSCMNCDFYKKVQAEEGTIAFKLMKPGQKYKPSSR